MSQIITHKKVEFIELFYDLVFVYALSKTTGFIHHLEDGVVPAVKLITFLLTMVILLNIWMIQMVFTNRYGRQSLANLSLIFANMVALIFMSNSLNTEWQDNFALVALTVAFLSLTLFLQYLFQYRRVSRVADRQLIVSYLWILGLRTVLVAVSVFFPYPVGVVVYLLGLLASVLLPAFFQKQMAAVAINFPHLVERLSLLVIIALGEMIVSGVAPFFVKDELSLTSLLNFLVVAFFFLLYFGMMDKAVDRNKTSLGVSMIYLHYLIIIGILLVTVSLSFLAEATANHYFVLFLLYLGLGLFLTGIFLLRSYSQIWSQLTKTYLLRQAMFYIWSLVVSLFWVANPMVILVSALLMLLLMTVDLARISQRQDIGWLA